MHDFVGIQEKHGNCDLDQQFEALFRRKNFLFFEQIPQISLAKMHNHIKNNFVSFFFP